MAQVPAVKTPVPSAQMLAAFQQAYKNVVGTDPPSKSSYAIPCAQSALETGHWASMYNYNAGNVTHGSDSYDFMYEGTNSLKFRSYPDVQTGADDMMRVLKKDGVVPFADSGDVAGYVEQLATTCYVGCRKPGYDPYPAYLTAMQSLTNEFLGVTPTPIHQPPLKTIESEAQIGKVLQGLLIGGAVVGSAAVAWHAYKSAKHPQSHKYHPGLLARSNPIPKIPKLTKRQTLLLGGAVTVAGIGTAVYLLSKKNPSLSPSPNPNPSPTQGSFGAAVLSDAKSDLGVTETSNPSRVAQYLSNYGFTTHVNWCAAAVGTWISEAAKSISATTNTNIKAPIPGSASARSTGDQFDDATNPKVGWWSAAELQSNPNLVMPGMVVVWSRGAASSHLGHIGIVSVVNQDFSNGNRRSGNPTETNFDFKSIEGNSGPTGGVVGEWPHSIDSVSLVGMGYFNDAAIGITAGPGVGYLVDPPGVKLFDSAAPELSADHESSAGMPTAPMKLLKA